MMQNYQFIEKLKSLPFVEEIWLFGSRARGDNDERSDIDLAIICTRASPAEWSEVNAIIENADTLLKMDCVRFDTLKAGEKIKENIEKFKQVLYKKERGQNMDRVFWKDSFLSFAWRAKQE